MAALIEEEWLDADGRPAKCHHSRQQPKRKLKSKRTNITADDVEDEDDGDFSASDSDHTSNYPSTQRLSYTPALASEKFHFAFSPESKNGYKRAQGVLQTSAGRL